MRYVHNRYDVTGLCSVFGTRVTRDWHEEIALNDLVSRFFAISSYRRLHVTLRLRGGSTRYRKSRRTLGSRGCAWRMRVVNISFQRGPPKTTCRSHFRLEPNLVICRRRVITARKLSRQFSDKYSSKIFWELLLKLR